MSDMGEDGRIVGVGGAARDVMRVHQSPELAELEERRADLVIVGGEDRQTRKEPAEAAAVVKL